jgi:hypothetical protein
VQEFNCDEGYELYIDEDLLPEKLKGKKYYGEKR